MDIKALQTILNIGENVGVEFKRCGNGIEQDTYESVCAFLNRFGGDLFMGILDNGKVIGVPEKAVSDMVKNFVSVVSNPALFTPTIYLVPEIMKYEGHAVIHVHVPPSAEVHSFKRVIYDRIDDADVKVTATTQIAAMYIRKQNIFTEKKIYPYVELEDLRLDLLPRLRQMAVNNSNGSHPWETMNDAEMLQSAGLYGKDRTTGEKGYNLAAVMLLGKDDVIMDICPAYETDALVRKVNVDRYDDCEIIRTNLIESYERLMEFARKHLPDKFFLEGAERRSLRTIIAREMLGNTLIHREFSSSYTAKFVIEKERMFVENANRATGVGIVTPENLEPNPKNPIIASFFRNIGWSDRLGSGVKNLFKYSKYYSGQEPEFVEGDVFRIIVPLNEAYSYDAEKPESYIIEVYDKERGYTIDYVVYNVTDGKTDNSTDGKTEIEGKRDDNTDGKTDDNTDGKTETNEKTGDSTDGKTETNEKTDNSTDGKTETNEKTGNNTDGKTGNNTDGKTETGGKRDDNTDGKTDNNTDGKTDDNVLTETEQDVLDVIKVNPAVTQEVLAVKLGLSNSGIRYVMRRLKKKGVLSREGSRKKGVWKIGHE